MHLLVPFANPGSAAANAALPGLRLPQLSRLLARLRAAATDDAEPTRLSPPHERALARELGYHGDDGALPWAAHWAAADGLDPGGDAWALLSPTHWHVGADLVTVSDPDALALDEAASRALLAVLAPLFEADGFAVRWGAPTRWYVAHPSLAGLRSASLDRVIGRNIDPWLPADPAARMLRRLQSEAQMLLHDHPLNVEREARGQLPVNSFWLSGCGVAQPARPAPGLQVLDALRAPALAADGAGWQQAWQALDAGPIAAAADAAERADAPVVLTLCGERAAQRFEPAPAAGWWSRWTSSRRQRDIAATLETL